MRIVALATGFAVAMAGSASAISITDAFTSFYTFGDSLSDDGKFGQLDPPSFEGRFSNGLVWAEYIEDDFIAAGRDTGNLAQGGAVAGPVNSIPAGVLDTFMGQVGVFANSVFNNVPLPEKVLPTVTFKDAPPSPGDNPLLSVWFGANDVFQGFDPFGAADDVADGIRALHALNNDLFDDFVLFGLPNLGLTPAFADRMDDGIAASNAFNFQLALNVAELESEGINIINFDPGSVVQKILDDIDTNGGRTYGILDGVTPCTISMGALLNPEVTNPGNCLDIGIDPNTLLFADAVHPNAVAHQIFAQDVTQAIKLAIVPLPASLPMLLVAFAGIGLASRRRVA